jgi:hypothetical protein
MSMVLLLLVCASNLAIARPDHLPNNSSERIKSPQIDRLQRGCGASEKAAVVVDVPQLLLYPVLVVGENFNEQVEHVDSFTATVPSRASTSPLILRVLR